MSAKGEKDGWGDKLRAAQRAREDLYFAKIDAELLEKIRAAETGKPAGAESAKATKNGDCPRCKEELRSGMWRDLEIEFCPACGGLWLDPGDLLELVDERGLDLHLTER